MWKHTKHNKGWNAALHVSGLKLPGFVVTQSGKVITSSMSSSATPTNDGDVVTKEYVDGIAGGASNLQEAYEGGGTVDINTATEGNVIFRDSGGTPVFTITEVNSQFEVPLALGLGQINGLGEPTGATDGATKAYADTTIGNVTDLQTAYDGGNTMDITGSVIFRDSGSAAVINVAETSVSTTKPISMGGNQITNLDTTVPPAASDAASKTYVDNAFTADNVGTGGGDVFRDATGTTVNNFRTITGTNGITAAVSVDIVQLTWGGMGKQVIDASTFAGATADVKINAALATADDGAVIIVDRGFTANETLADQIVFPLKQNLTIIFGKIEFDYTNPTNSGLTAALSENVFKIPDTMSYLTIKGAGSGTVTTANPTDLAPVTHFVWNAAAGSGYIAYCQDIHYITFQDMKFTGKNQGTGASGAIRTTISTTNGTQGLVLRDIHMDYMTRTMVNLATPLYCRFENVTLTRGGGSAVFCSSGTTNIFTNCYLHSFFDSGFRLQGTSYTTMVSCKANECGVGFLIRSTNAITLISCEATDTQWRDATYPGYGLRILDGANGTSVYSFRGTGFDDNVNQRFIDISDSTGTDIINPVFDNDGTKIPVNAIAVAVDGADVRIVGSSSNFKLSENGANTTMLLSNAAVDLNLVYDGYVINYGSRQEGPVFHDTSAAFRHLECDGAGVVTGVAWTPA